MADRKLKYIGLGFQSPEMGFALVTDRVYSIPDALRDIILENFDNDTAFQHSADIHGATDYYEITLGEGGIYEEEHIEP